jgi:hypothetical protein
MRGDSSATEDQGTKQTSHNDYTLQPNTLINLAPGLSSHRWCIEVEGERQPGALESSVSATEVRIVDCKHGCSDCSITAWPRLGRRGLRVALRFGGRGALRPAESAVSVSAETRGGESAGFIK